MVRELPRVIRLQAAVVRELEAAVLRDRRKHVAEPPIVRPGEELQVQRLLREDIDDELVVALCLPEGRPLIPVEKTGEPNRDELVVWVEIEDLGGVQRVAGDAR